MTTLPRANTTNAKSKLSFAALATAIILLAAPGDAAAHKPPSGPPAPPPTQPTPLPVPPAPPAPPKVDRGTVRDHRVPATVRDHRTNVRDHRTPAPVVVHSGGGVTVTSVPRKAKPVPQPAGNPYHGGF